MKGFILAAGLGTRLKPLTDQRAKPALPLLGVPTFWFAAWHMSQVLGIKEIAINVGHCANDVRAAAQDVSLLQMTGVKFFFSDESQQILGSSGALWKLRDWVGNSPLTVMNGDSLCLPNLQRLVKRHQKSKGLMTLHVRPHEQSREAYTQIEVDAQGRVLSFGEKQKNGVMFTGVYVIEPQALQRLPEGASDLMTTLLKPLSQERQLFAESESLSWFDTGTIVTYAEAQFQLLKSYPVLQVLVSLQMREERPGCWVPRHWPSPLAFECHGPCVMYGDYEKWRSVAQAYGPRVIAFSCEGQPQNQTAISHCIIYEKNLLKI